MGNKAGSTALLVAIIGLMVLLLYYGVDIGSIPVEFSIPIPVI